MAARTIYSCDRCAAEPAEQFAIDLGTGRTPIDLCVTCQEETGLRTLAKLLAEHGQIQASGQAKPSVKAKAKAAAEEPWHCPKCSASVGTRHLILSHLQSIHGYTKVSASQLVPPRGETIICEVCGFLTKPGTGYAAHVTVDHGRDTWEKIRARKESA